MEGIYEQMTKQELIEELLEYNNFEDWVWEERGISFQEYLDAIAKENWFKPNR